MCLQCSPDVFQMLLVGKIEHMGVKPIDNILNAVAMCPTRPLKTHLGAHFECVQHVITGHIVNTWCMQSQCSPNVFQMLSGGNIGYIGVTTVGNILNATTMCPVRTLKMHFGAHFECFQHVIPGHIVNTWCQESQCSLHVLTG